VLKEFQIHPWSKEIEWGIKKYLERDEIGEEKELSDPWRGETT
jgi:hypothetical protein